MSTVIQPLADRVVVRPVAAAEQSKGGIIIPDVAKEKPQEGLVVAVGPGRVDGGVLVPCRCRVGDRVLHGHFSGVEVTLDEVPHLILRETDVLAILTSVERVTDVLSRRPASTRVTLRCSRCAGSFVGPAAYVPATCTCGALFDEIGEIDRLPGVDATASDEADDTASPFIGY